MCNYLSNHGQKTRHNPCTSVPHVHRSGQSYVAPVLCSSTLWFTLCHPVVVTEGLCKSPQLAPDCMGAAHRVNAVNL